MQSIDKIAPLMVTPQKVVITTHQNPDADALGSSLALAIYFQKLNHQVTVISSTPYPTYLAWMAQSQNIVIFEHDPAKTIETLKNSTMLWCLDFNVITRTKTLSKLLANYQGTKVLIDHHIGPDEHYFNFGVSSTSKSSTCEMVYDYIIANNHAAYIDADIASCLYAGTMTDTGSFRFSSTTASTHFMVGHLLEAGAVPNKIHEAIFDTFPEKRLRLLGHVFCNRLEIIKPHNFALIALTEEDMQQYSVGQGDTEGIVNYPLSIGEVSMSAFMSPKEGEVRISFRSKGDVNVNEFAKKYFEGGGHFNAAGGKSTLSLSDTITKFKQVIKEHFI